jgi:hypothetical protein
MSAVPVAVAASEQDGAPPDCPEQECIEDDQEDDAQKEEEAQDEDTMDERDEEEDIDEEAPAAAVDDSLRTYGNMCVGKKMGFFEWRPWLGRVLASLTQAQKCKLADLEKQVGESFKAGQINPVTRRLELNSAKKKYGMVKKFLGAEHALWASYLPDHGWFVSFKLIARHGLREFRNLSEEAKELVKDGELTEWGVPVPLADIVRDARLVRIVTDFLENPVGLRAFVGVKFGPGAMNRWPFERQAGDPEAQILMKLLAMMYHCEDDGMSLNKDWRTAQDNGAGFVDPYVESDADEVEKKIKKTKKGRTLANGAKPMADEDEDGNPAPPTSVTPNPASPARGTKRSCEDTENEPKTKCTKCECESSDSDAKLDAKLDPQIVEAQLASLREELGAELSAEKLRAETKLAALRLEQQQQELDLRQKHAQTIDGLRARIEAAILAGETTANVRAAQVKEELAASKVHAACLQHALALKEGEVAQLRGSWSELETAWSAMQQQLVSMQTDLDGERRRHEVFSQMLREQLVQREKELDESKKRTQGLEEQLSKAKADLRKALKRAPPGDSESEDEEVPGTQLQEEHEEVPRGKAGKGAPTRTSARRK